MVQRVVIGSHRGMSADVRPSGAAGATGDNATRCGRVLAISGATNSGKTVLAHALTKMLKEDHCSVEVVHQDDFFLPKDRVERVTREPGSNPPFYYNYDVPSSVDLQALVNAVNKAVSRADFVVLDGHMVCEWRELFELCDRVIFLMVDQDTCRRRRLTRRYDPPDEEMYFDNVVWPAYLHHLRNAMALARDDGRISFVDASSSSDEPTESVVRSVIHSFSDDIIRICFEPLDIAEAASLVNTPSCGATSMFVGTTRDTFNGKRVVRLDYESYDEMAYKELRRLCALAHEKYPTLERVLLQHRIGEVAVGEASVIVATASPHRWEATRATEMLVDELKRTVPIWKKEVYADGSCSWKANGEWDGCCTAARAAADPPEQPVISEETSFAQAKRTRDANRRVFWLRQMVRNMKAQ